ncbi:protein-L-isoaspartate O-methyltransferase [uncultured Sphingomonas sp.]|uniref:protein-L-isoaspartate O-methyltransferase family protein n=1 Tax=uncultured Sphingomonas sp. TaxID=158754 RepID=UPI00260E1449|nr:protein-L-isoaspartate O-methyltransferase [uncultured Sphingomonas sp.]
MSEQEYDRLRRAMVSNQLRPNLVANIAVLSAMALVPRETFVGEGQGALAYRDTIVPLGGGRGLNPPAATGRLLDAADPRPGERALVVGAASGYVAALLVTLGCVVTVVDDAAMLATAKAALGGGVAVDFVDGPLAAGAPANAPYDIVYIDGGVERVPSALIEQMVEDGRLVTAILERGVSRLSVGRRAGASVGLRAFADIDTVPLPGFTPAPAFTF